MRLHMLEKLRPTSVMDLHEGIKAANPVKLQGGGRLSSRYVVAHGNACDSNLTYTMNSQMRTTLTQAFEHSRLPDREFLAYLTSLQEKLTRELADNL